jgi:hypothetical protein
MTGGAGTGGAGTGGMSTGGMGSINTPGTSTVSAPGRLGQPLGEQGSGSTHSPGQTGTGTSSPSSPR